MGLRGNPVFFPFQISPAINFPHLFHFGSENVLCSFCFLFHSAREAFWSGVKGLWRI